MREPLRIAETSLRSPNLRGYIVMQVKVKTLVAPWYTQDMRKKQRYNMMDGTPTVFRDVSKDRQDLS